VVSGEAWRLFREAYPERDFLKDRLGDQRGGGSEWEPIKILLEGD
jgi:hypothetical protein